MKNLNTEDTQFRCGTTLSQGKNNDDERMCILSVSSPPLSHHFEVYFSENLLTIEAVKH
jgi:hypothetical protein